MEWAPFDSFIAIVYSRDQEDQEDQCHPKDTKENVTSTVTI